MKNTITLFLLLVTATAFSQVQKLGELSSGKFIGSRIIYEDNREDVFGYFLLYEFDRKSKEVYELEYVILDKNLNKLSSATFIQGAYKNFLAKIEVQLSFVKKIKNEVFFGLYDDSKAFVPPMYLNLVNQRYRRINLETFTLSEEFVLQDFKTIEKKYKEGDVLLMKDITDNQGLIPTNSGYFLTFALTSNKLGPIMGDINKEIDRIRSGVKSFSILDANMKTVWSKNINADKITSGVYKYYGSDKNTLVLHKDFIKRKVKENFIFEVYDIASGRLITEVKDEDPEYRISPDQVLFSDNEVVFYFHLYELKDKDLHHEKTLGYAKVVIDKKTGNEISRDYLLWNNLAPHITFKDKYGNINKYGRLIVQEFVYLDNGNTLAIAEGYKMQMSSQILDLFVMELDPKMKAKYVHKVAKQKNTLTNRNLSGQNISYYGLFDYYYSQKLDNEGNYVFFYANNEKEGSSSAKRKNPDWVLGIVTYVDGEFGYDKLQLTSKGSQIMPGKAKNGYIRLLEVGEKDTELRLEKINY